MNNETPEVTGQNDQSIIESNVVANLSTVPVEQSTNTGSAELVAKVVKKSRKKAEKAPVEATIEVKVATLKVDGLKFTEMVAKNPREMAVDTTFVVGQKSILLQPALVSIIESLTAGRDLNTPVAVPRKKILNGFCIANQITPLPCKQMNKTENKTTATYGEVPDFTDKFDVSGSTYQTLGFLKFPLIRTANFVAVKHDVYLVVMTEATYQLYVAGTPELLKDQQFEIL